MKALVVEKPEMFSVLDVSYPEPGPGEVTIKVKACCICGTDIHIIKGEIGALYYPVIPGHEFAGTIDRVSEGVQDLKIGDVVSIEPYISCGYCYFCQKGDYNVCVNGGIIGHSAESKDIKVDGGFAEYVTVPRRNVYVFRKASFQEASFLPNLNTVVYALRRARFQPGDNILIIGAGTMGLLYVQLAKAAGSPLVVITDKAQNRLELAEELGADAGLLADKDLDVRLKKLTPFGFDIVVECVGDGELVKSCFQYVRDRGKILLFGLAPSTHKAMISPFDVAKRNLEIIGSLSATFCGPATRDLIDNGIIKINPLITHTFSLADFGKALEQAMRPHECIRVIVEP